MKRSNRMIKGIVAAALALCLASSVTGCAKRTIVVSQHDNNPQGAIPKNIKIDWDQVKTDCESVLDKETYPHGSYLDFAVHDEQKVIELIWPMTEDANQLESLDYGKAYIRAFNDAVATQDPSYAFSTDSYYGGLWDKYGIDLQLYKESVILYPDKYFVNQVMDPGSNDPVLPLTEEDLKEMDESAAAAKGSSAAGSTTAAGAAAAKTTAAATKAAVTSSAAAQTSSGTKTVNGPTAASKAATAITSAGKSKETAGKN